jgi:hypothetical protein
VLGSLDPHVARYDIQLLQGEVRYFDEMQFYMNSRAKWGHWNWRSQIVGIINSWHDGYPSYEPRKTLVFRFSSSAPGISSQAA